MKIRFVQDLIDTLRGKRKSIAKITKENDIQIPKKLLKKIKLNVVGKNNTIIIDEIIGNDFELIIDIYGDNNKIKIDKGFHLSKLSILIGQNHPNFGKVKNHVFTIGKNTSIGVVSYITYNGNSYCHIGDDCMFAYDITLYNTDAHPIFDKNTGELLNKVKGIEIGDHCWIGKGVTILKNSIVPSNSIIGWNTVYVGVNKNEYCAFAGNPARVVKENVTWNSNGSSCGYVENI